MLNLGDLLSDAVTANTPTKQPSAEPLFRRAAVRRRAALALIAAIPMVAFGGVVVASSVGQRSHTSEVLAPANSGKPGPSPTDTPNAFGHASKEPTYEPATGQPPVPHNESQLLGPNAFSIPSGPRTSTSTYITRFQGHNINVVAGNHNGVGAVFLTQDLGAGTGHASTEWIDAEGTTSLTIVAFDEAAQRLTLRGDSRGLLYFTLNDRKFRS